MVDSELHPIARELMERLRTRIMELLDRAKAEGQLATKTDTNALAWELDALRNGLVIQWTLNGEGPLREWLQHGLLSYLEGKKR